MNMIGYQLPILLGSKIEYDDLNDIVLLIGIL